MQEDPTTRIVNAILAKGGKARKHGKDFKATCPAHEDTKPSLEVGYGDKGAVLYCHAGCTPEDIVKALGLTMDDLFDAPLEKHAEDMPLRAAAPNAEATYVYEDENGKVLFRVERHRGKKFIQARPDHGAPGKWIYTLGNVRRVPYRLTNIAGAIKGGDRIWIVEGEKDVHAMEAIGLVATCNAGGAGKFKREYAEFFGGADVVVVPDNDTPGKDHGTQVADSLGQVAHYVRILDLPYLPDKGDVGDFIVYAQVCDKVLGWMGCHDAIDPAAALQAMATEVTPKYTNKPVIFNAFDLMAEKFPDVVMAVPGVVAEGATFLVGAPKIGKSWMSLGLGLAVAQGGMALGTIPVEAGPVLYLALEDTPRRLQRRLFVMIGTTEAPKNLHFACTWPRLGSGGLDQLEDWLKEHPDARMVIIDTWAKVKSSVNNDQGGSMYQDDYAAVSAVKSLADEYETAIVMIHHQRKATDGDPLNTVAGSTGLTGAADATVILTRPRGAEEGHLYVTGRDVEESKSIVSFDGTTGQWTWLGEAEDVEETRTVDSVVKLLEASAAPMGPKEIAEKLEMKEGTAKWLVAKLAQEGKITRVSRGQYMANGNVPLGSPGGSQPSQPIQGGAIVNTVQPPLPGTPGKDQPFGTMHLSDDDIEKLLAGDEGYEEDEE